MSLVSDIINQAFLDLGAIAVGEPIATAMQTDGFTRLNQMLGSLSAEGLTVPNQVMQTFNLVFATVAYTLGSGGSLATAGGLRAMKVTAWRANSNLMSKGGRALSMPEFGQAQAQAQTALAELYTRAAEEGLIVTVPASLTAAVPSVLAADTSYPLINVRIFPPPSNAPGSIELAYWTPFLSFASVNDPVNLAPGLEDLLHFVLAQRLYPQYPRPSNKDHIWDMAERARNALIEQNAMSSPQPQPAAPKGQQ